MMNPHTSLSIAQIVFYAPVFPLSLWLLIRNWRHHPRMAWYPFIPFSLIRIVGAGVTIALEQDRDNVGLAITAIVLLNVGVIPLMLSYSGFTRIIFMDNYPDTRRGKRLLGLIRFGLIAALALISAGGGISGQQNEHSRTLGRALLLAGYITMAVILAGLIVINLYFLTMRNTLISSSRKVVIGALFASPFLIVRTIYGMLGVIFGYWTSLTWNPLYGSVATFVVMGLIMEYVMVIIFLYVGLSMAPDRGVVKVDDENKV